MAWFPLFVDLNDKDVLIVGGGRVAVRKAARLRGYGPRLTVAAPEMEEALLVDDTLVRIPAPFAPEMLHGRDMVIAATDDRTLNRRIGELCRERKICVNVVDDREACSFLFPSLVKKGDLSIGICTGGASPTAAVWCREQIEQLLPEQLPEILSYLDALRPAIKDSLPNEQLRARVFRQLFVRCLALGRTPGEEELREIQEGGWQL